MSIVICFNNKDARPWSKILKEKLKGIDIEIYPNVKSFDKIIFALCWKPEKNVLAQFPNLKVIQSVGASVNQIIQSQNLLEDILLTRIIDNQLSEDMFEFILTGIMFHIKRFSDYNNNQKQKVWDQKPYQTIKNTSISILGLGKIGAHVAKKLEQFGFKVQAWSKSKKDIKNVSCHHGKEGFDKAMCSADILINILPLTAETDGILNFKNLKRLNKNAYLINVGRGEHLVETDLLALLDYGHLSGALLDVFRKEPLPNNHPFWQNKKIKITPHIAAITNVETASDIVVTNYNNLLRGGELLNTVSLKKGY